MCVFSLFLPLRSSYPFLRVRVSRLCVLTVFSGVLFVFLFLSLSPSFYIIISSSGGYVDRSRRRRRRRKNV